ncbi:cfa4df2f-dc5a-4824-bb2c-003dfc027937 [Sclerotinia trifoliorum]|uniref:Cfa4df2f-dc5a-4824-bb2c-003dfc027937 n=1 Tax=Sclerotinia trifoliorum TaxID=28548 RepID=A0A8H2VY05_9HELO|nr:cfa4df2f-dc5a-4824-bb2c-003dfc027937 [Sclerotinia trifoliorum]
MKRIKTLNDILTAQLFSVIATAVGLPFNIYKICPHNDPTADPANSLVTHFPPGGSNVPRSCALEEPNFDVESQAHRGGPYDYLEDDIDMNTGTPGLELALEPVFQCRFEARDKICPYSTNREADWVRHEEYEKHWPQNVTFAYTVPSHNITNLRTLNAFICLS